MSARRLRDGASKRVRAVRKPILRHIANLWSLVGYPSPKKEWSLEQKLRAVKAAGFDGFIGKPLDFDRFPQQILSLLQGNEVWMPR